MRRQLEYERNEIRCRNCRYRVAFVRDYLHILLHYIPAGIFERLFNVDVPEGANYRHHVVDGSILANTYCSRCRMLLGWQFIAVAQPTMHIREGRFYMRLHLLSYWNDVPLLHLNELGLGANQQIANQGANANEQNADQHGDANEQIPNEQDLGANEQNADQDGNVNEQVHNEQDVGANEQNADQDGNANEQVPNEQDVGANEQNAVQDGGGNEQNHDEDGGAPMNRRKM